MRNEGKIKIKDLKPKSEQGVAGRNTQMWNICTMLIMPLFKHLLYNSHPLLVFSKKKGVQIYFFAEELCDYSVVSH